MSDFIQHECGIALIRLLKPLSFYREKYGTPLYGLNKLYLLMEKQHNRGQDGAGLATIKFNMPPGKKYISTYRTVEKQPIDDVFSKVQTAIQKAQEAGVEQRNSMEWWKENIEFIGELLMGHLRYGTYGKYSLENCHPVIRENNWLSRNLALAGNFNLTNIDELFQNLLELGQHPLEDTDTLTMLEKMGHFLDKENQRLFEHHKKKGKANTEISRLIEEELDIPHILQKSVKNIDGGYVMAGMIGHGDAFVIRDPAGIRPVYHYQDEEVLVVASERPAIQTAFNVSYEKVKEIKPGHALIVKKNGKIGQYKCKTPRERRSCSFERIYFSRGSDADIYKERKKLGYNLVPDVMEAIDQDLANTVFSFIPNTAEVAFSGLIKGIEEKLNQYKKQQIEQQQVSGQDLQDILEVRPRVEKIAVKDVKMRTFITQASDRKDLVAHVYDVTYGVIRSNKDTLVVLDDSIVRGNTLKESILGILDRLDPKKIVVVSSAPQIRYPDCYGIDMARLGNFVAFRAAIALLEETGQEDRIQQVYKEAKEQCNRPKEEAINVVKKIYDPFTPQQISDKIAEIIRPDDLQAELKIIYQSIEDLHDACPNHQGDWYFSGNYPTPGGNKVVNKSYINYIEGKNQRAY